MTKPTNDPRESAKTEDLEDRPVTGETIENGNKQESPTGREWDAERENGGVPADELESVTGGEMLQGNKRGSR